MGLRPPSSDLPALSSVVLLLRDWRRGGLPFAFGLALGKERLEAILCLAVPRTVAQPLIAGPFVSTRQGLGDLNLRRHIPVVFPYRLDSGPVVAFVEVRSLFLKLQTNYVELEISDSTATFTLQFLHFVLE